GAATAPHRPRREEYACAGRRGHFPDFELCPAEGHPGGQPAVILEEALAVLPARPHAPGEELPQRDVHFLPGLALPQGRPGPGEAQADQPAEAPGREPRDGAARVALGEALGDVSPQGPALAEGVLRDQDFAELIRRPVSLPGFPFQLDPAVPDAPDR